MKDKKSIIGCLLFALLQLFSLSSCSEDAAYDTATSKQEQILNLLISTGESKSATRTEEEKQGTVAENSIRSLRVIIFEINATGEFGKQMKNEIFTWDDSTTDGPLHLNNISFEKTNRVQVLLIANERPEWMLEDTNKSAATIKNQAVVYGDAKKGYVTIGTPIVMFAQSDMLDGQSNQNIVVQMKRNLARVDLTLTCNASDISELELEGGELLLTSACIKQMAPQTNIEEGDIHTGFKPEDCLVSTDIAYVLGENYRVEKKGEKFSGFETDKISFYVPEHYVTDVHTHTYIAIYGKYIPEGGSAEQGVPVEYFLPIGEGLIKTGFPNIDLTNEDLFIKRNHLYEFRASFKTLRKVNVVYANVVDWNKTWVNGDIGVQKYLNVSDLTPTVYQKDTTKVQFWTNLTTDICVLSEGTTEGATETFTVNDIFESLAGEVNKVENFTFEAEAQWGRLNLIPKRTLGEETYGKTYIITLAAGTLQRTIKVKLAKAATQAIDK